MQIISDNYSLMQKPATLQSKFVAKLKEAKLRNTHVRQAIFNTLIESHQPLSIQELSSLIDNAHFVSIYRSVDAMQNASILKMVPRGFKNLFELGDSFKPHHHHVTCEICFKTTEIQDQRLETLMTDITIGAGLKPTTHHFELSGVCTDCQIL